MTRAARLLIFACVVATFGASAPVAVAVDSSTTTAVIVIDTGNGTRTALVDVGSGMSGLAVLQQVATVTTYGYAGQGGAVCSIDGVGNDATACLVGPNGQYWAYFHSRNGATSWSYSPVGAGSYTVRGGDVEGWRYGTGQKPAASPTFCDHVACSVTPTPPAPTDAPAGSVGGTAGGTGEGPAVGIPNGSTGGSAGGSANGSANGSTGSTGQPGDPATGTGPTQPATATTQPSGPNGEERPKSAKRGDGVNAEAASLRRAGAGDGSGSPVGVAVVIALLAIGAGSAIWLRRRTRAPG